MPLRRLRRPLPLPLATTRCFSNFFSFSITPPSSSSPAAMCRRRLNMISPLKITFAFSRLPSRLHAAHRRAMRLPPAAFRLLEAGPAHTVTYDSIYRLAGHRPRQRGAADVSTGNMLLVMPNRDRWLKKEKGWPSRLRLLSFAVISPSHIITTPIRHVVVIRHMVISISPFRHFPCTSLPA